MGNKFSRPVRHNVREQRKESRQYGTIQTMEGDRMITREKLIHHIETMRERHDDLDKQIKELYEHHANDLKVEELKKKKLKLKDEIEQTSSKLKKFD